MSDDYTSDKTTTGSVTVGGEAAGEIETGNDFDWFAVELVAGKTYVIDLEGADSGGGTLDSTVLRGLYDSEGNRIAGTQTNDGGDDDDARLYFTAKESGTYYIAARGYMNATGTYTVRVTDTTSETGAEDTDAVRSGAETLGDITQYTQPRFPTYFLDGGDDKVDYYSFTLTEAKLVGLGLRGQEANADLFLEDENGKVIGESTKGSTANEWISKTLLAGTTTGCATGFPIPISPWCPRSSRRKTRTPTRRLRSRSRATRSTWWRTRTAARPRWRWAGSPRAIPRTGR